MQITTNLQKGDTIHDCIAYPSIQKQLFDLFKERTATEITYRLLSKNSMAIYFGDVKHISYKMSCAVDIKTKGVNIIVSGMGLLVDTFKLTLPYNQLINKKINRLLRFVQKYEDIKVELEKIQMPNQTEIQKFLQSELAVKPLYVSYHRNDPAELINIFFYLHPEKQAPADGISLCYDNGKVEPWWNKSTPKRTLYGGNDHEIERVFTKTNLSLREKADSLEQLNAKIEAFDPQKSPEFMQLLEVQKQVKKLKEELDEIKVTKE